MQHRSACPLDCWDACGFLVETDAQGRVISIKGDPSHPITQGFVCQKAKRLLERNYSQDRIQTPLLKKDGKFQPISWDQAIELWAEKTQEILDDHSSQDILWYHDYGSGGLLKNLEARFFNLIGPVTRSRGDLCWAAGIAAQEKDFGKVLSHPPEDIYNAGCIVVWGKNPALTSVHFQAMLVKAKKQGIPLVVIDPIASETASIADLHVQPFPGSDGWLALGLAKLILEGVQGPEPEAWSQGFEEYKELVTATSLDMVLSKTKLEEASLRKMADFLAKKPVQFWLGYGLQRYHDSFNTVRHINALGAILGSIGIQGGGVNYAQTFWDDILDTKAITLEKEHNTFPKPELGDYLTANDVKMMVVSRANPLVQAPNSAAVARGFKKVPFKVVLELVHTDTSRAADLVLPCTTFLEEENIFMSNMWHTTINYAKPATKPFAESKTEGEIYQALASKLGLEFPQRTPREWLELALAPAAQYGITLDKLEKRSLGPRPSPKLPWHDKSFATPSGKFQFIHQLPDSPHVKEGEFILLTPHRASTMHSQLFPQGKKEHVLMINPETQGGLSKGIIQSELGELEVLVNQTNKVPPGVGVLYQGGSKATHGKSVNILTPSKASKIGDGAIFNQCICKLKKI